MLKLITATTLIVCASVALAQETGSTTVPLRSAFVIPARQAIVTARETGTLVKFDVQPGDVVQSGDLIGALDAEESRLLVARARLDLTMATQTAESRLAVETAQQLLLESRQSQKQSQLSRNIASVLSNSEIQKRAAAARLESSKGELERARRSREKLRTSISQTEFDRLQLAVNTAEIEVEKAQQDHEVAALQLKLEESALEEKHQAVKRYEIALKQAENDLKLTDLMKQQREVALRLAEEMHRRREFRSPIAGEVAETFVESGEWVKVGDKVARVISLDQLSVEGFVDADYSRDQLKNSAATIIVRHPTDSVKIKGQVKFVSPEVDRRNRQFRILVEFDNRRAGLSPGLSAEVSLDLPDRSSQDLD